MYTIKENNKEKRKNCSQMFLSFSSAVSTAQLLSSSAQSVSVKQAIERRDFVYLIAYAFFLKSFSGISK